MTDDRTLVQRDAPSLPAPTTLDRIIGWISPETAVRRYHARLTFAAATSWVAASRTRSALKRWTPWARDADSDSLTELSTMRARSRDAMRNTPVARGAILTNATSVVGAGLKMRPMLDAKMLGMEQEEVEQMERLMKAHYLLWSSSVYSDTHTKQPFVDQQGLAWRSFLENGDVFALTPMRARAGWPYETTVQLIEADRISNPNWTSGEMKLASGNVVHNGIEKTPDGDVIAVHIAPTHPGAVRRLPAGDWRRVTIRGPATGRVNVIHLHDPERIGESRGIPYLAPVIEVLKQLGRFTDAELAAAVISSMFTVFFESEQGIGFGGAGGPNAQTEQTAPSGQSQYEMGTGAMIELAAGQTVKFADPTRPADSFDPFVNAVLRQVGVSLEIPYELLIKHFTSSYTAARASMVEAWRYFYSRRSFFARTFCQPIYELLLEELLLTNRLSMPGFMDDPMLRSVYSHANWIGPARGQINEKVETESAIARMNANLTTLDQETSEATGGDWEVNVQQRAIEQQRLDRAGLSSTDSTGSAGADVSEPSNPDEDDPDAAERRQQEEDEMS